ncbi:MAG: hypothetical protein V1898_01745 [Patescibacteria group bacterium]
MSKYLHYLKKFLIHNYGFVVIAVAMIYSSIMLYNIYKNIYDLYQNEDALIQAKGSNSVNQATYKSIINKEIEKQKDSLPNKIINPF